MVLVDGGGGDVSVVDLSFDRDDFRDVGVRRGMVPSLMGTMPVEVVFVGGENLAGVRLTEEQDVQRRATK